jgi:hypothetical protein
MNNCPNCGKVAGLHSSILQGCMCQYSMQAPPQRTWVGLTDAEINKIRFEWLHYDERARAIEAKLKEKNNG